MLLDRIWQVRSFAGPSLDTMNILPLALPRFGLTFDVLLASQSILGDLLKGKIGTVVSVKRLGVEAWCGVRACCILVHS